MSFYLECTLDLCQFNSILCIVILDNFIFTLTWYSKRLDIVNERGLTGLFTISRLGCTTITQIFFPLLIYCRFTKSTFVMSGRNSCHKKSFANTIWNLLVMELTIRVLLLEWHVRCLHLTLVFFWSAAEKNDNFS